MIITKLECLAKNKYKVYLNGAFAFVLYGRELDLYQLEEGSELEDPIYRKIFEEVLWKRAQKKTLDSLGRRDKTEYELRASLKRDLFPEEIINRTIEYLKNHRYLDDLRYAKNYVSFKKNSKSKMQIKSELLAKGVEKDYIVQVFMEWEDDSAAIEKAIRSKTANVELLTFPEKQKIAGYLYRKGFQMEEIQDHLNLF